MEEPCPVGFSQIISELYFSFFFMTSVARPVGAVVG